MPRKEKREKIELIQTRIRRATGADTVTHLGGTDWFLKTECGGSPFRAALQIEMEFGCQIEVKPPPGDYAYQPWKGCGLWRGSAYGYLSFTFAFAGVMDDCWEDVPEIPPSSDGYTYFIRCGDRVKIGRSADPLRRMAALSMSNPEALQLLGVLPGSDRESELHRRFAHQRLRGEWFSLDGELAAFIQTLAFEAG
jgi:hypothetical protein